MTGALRLHAIERGAGPPLVILHGLLGAAQNWGGFTQKLAPHHRVIALDLRNHGRSPWSAVMDYPAMAEDVRLTLDEMGIERAALLGHSMGGKAAMAFAFAHPERLSRLIVADIAPVTYPPQQLPLIAAMRGLDVARLPGRQAADAALAAAVPDAFVRGFLLQNLTAEPAGGYRWRANVAVLEAAMPAIAGFPEPDRVHGGPTLFIRGGASDYVPPAAEPRIRALFPDLRLVTIPNAGHYLHVERPAEFLAAVETFLVS
jgi:pimeloyl-ACP methyl ester carboxylesterase